jgi:hypothetical protein
MASAEHSQSRPSGEAASPLRPYLSTTAEVPEWDDEAAAPDQSAGGDDAARLPPYLLTGGRARPIDADLEIEAQVVATPAGLGDLRRLTFENRDIVALCEQPLAIAEVAGRLSLHLGVTRVLVSDLVTTGHLFVRRPDVNRGRRLQIIERVIRGLEQIS